MDAGWLVVAEAPGPDEEDEGRPLIGPSGWIFESAGIGPARIKRRDVRIENVNQCRAPAESPRGRQAQKRCGPSLMDIVRAMPNLRFIVAMGEPALEWVSGWATWELEARAARNALTAWERKASAYAGRIAKWEDKVRTFNEARDAAELAGKKFKRKPPKPPAPLADRPSDPPLERGFHTITNWRGSRLSVHLEGRSFDLFPTMHPASVMAFRQPRLKPLFTMDWLKAARLARGEIIVPEHETVDVRSGLDLEFFFQRTPRGRIALDLEWSRRGNELQCLAIGRDSLYALIPWRDLGEPSVREAIRSVLQREFDAPEREWGGHFASGFDERKLAEMGLVVRSAWDSLYGFHVAFAEIGSTRDESNPDLTQASGYDLGFVMSVLTPMSYHKFEWGERDAADIESSLLYPYCTLDTKGSWMAMEAMAREFDVRWGRDAHVAWGLMQADMERTRLATEMGRNGMPIRDDRRERALAWLTAKLAMLEHDAREAAGNDDFNPHSLPQLERYLDAQHIALRSRTQTGRAKLDKKVIASLVEKHPSEPVLRVIGEIRGLQEREIAVYKGLEPDDRGLKQISWKIHGTVGARWSSNPNVQNLTSVQKLVVGREGWHVVVADLDAAELRVAAVLANQRDLVEQLARDESPHLATARELFGREIRKSVDHEEYTFAKSTNYRFIYTLPDEPLSLEGGQLRTYRVEVSPHALARITHWLNRRWPMIVRYKRTIVSNVQATGFVRSPDGRMRDLRWAVRAHATKLKNHAYRAALNFPIQTCVGDQVGRAFEEAAPKIRALNGGWIFANEHDSLAAIVRPEHVDEARAVLREAMERPVESLGGYVIPASVKCGDSWGNTS